VCNFYPMKHLLSILGWLAFVLALQVPVTYAQTTAEKSAKPLTDLIVGSDKGSELQLEVRQMPLAQVLDSIAKQTKVPIHYSILPEGVITATCVGSNLKPVLECLLDRKTDIIVRYLRKKNDIANKNQIAEAWILGSKLEAIPNSALCKAETGQGSMSLSGDVVETGLKANHSDLLLKTAQTGNPKDRAEAIGNLLEIGAQNDPKIKALLEEAVHDKSAEVRAQAVSTLTHRLDYSEKAPQIIQEALQDSNVDVRLMAVDGINDDVGLLQQAVNDSDETVRTVAQMKLEELMKQQTKGK
jgi:hypothetical protein